MVLQGVGENRVEGYYPMKLGLHKRVFILSLGITKPLKITLHGSILPSIGCFASSKTTLLKNEWIYHVKSISNGCPSPYI